MLSILIVNFRTPQLTIDCIRSVKQHTHGIDYEIIVMDNDSGDNSEILIGSAFPDIQVFQYGSNAGFARANNKAMDLAKGDTFLLLNSDTLAHDNAIGNAYRDLSASAYGACGVQLLNADGSPQISGNYFMKGSINLWLSIPYIGSWLKSLGELTKVKKPNIPDSNEPVEVDWINGAFLMVKRSVVDRVGKMDADFFLYAEESEWCFRIKKYAPLCIFGQYKITHLIGASSKTAFDSNSNGYANIFDRKGFQFLLSNFVRVFKQHGKAWFYLHLMVFTISVPIVYIGSFFASGMRKEKLQQSKGLGANVKKLWSYASTITSGKPHFYKVL